MWNFGSFLKIIESEKSSLLKLKAINLVLTHQTRGMKFFEHPHVFLETKGSDFFVANICHFAKNILLQIPFFLFLFFLKNHQKMKLFLKHYHNCLLFERVLKIFNFHILG